jgi:predicted ester cyclase
MRRILLILPALLLLAGCDIPRYGGTGGSAQQNKAIVRGYFDEIINQGRWDTWDKYFHRQIEFNDRLIDKHDLQRLVTSFKASYPDFTITVVEQIAEGDQVVSRVTCRGTHLGPDEGIAATGKEVVYPGVAIDRIKDGKVIEMRYMGDVWARIQQIQSE